MTESSFTVIFNTMCLCMKFPVAVPEVVSLIYNFIDTLSLHFQKRSATQIRILEVITWACTLIITGTR